MYGLGVGSNSSEIYVGNGSSDSVYVIDSRTGNLIKDIHMGFTPYGVAVNSNTGRVYVSSLGASFVSVIDGSTKTKIVTINVPEFPGGILAALIPAFCVTMLAGNRKLKNLPKRRMDHRSL
jgi:YVTN family beta-propeller protein